MSNTDFYALKLSTDANLRALLANPMKIDVTAVKALQNKLKKLKQLKQNKEWAYRKKFKVVTVPKMSYRNLNLAITHSQKTPTNDFKKLLELRNLKATKLHKNELQAQLNTLKGKGPSLTLNETKEMVNLEGRLRTLSRVRNLTAVNQNLLNNLEARYAPPVPRGISAGGVGRVIGAAGSAMKTAGGRAVGAAGSAMKTAGGRALGAGRAMGFIGGQAFSALGRRSAVVRNRALGAGRAMQYLGGQAFGAARNRMRAAKNYGVENEEPLLETSTSSGANQKRTRRNKLKQFFKFKKRQNAYSNGIEENFFPLVNNPYAPEEQKKAGELLGTFQTLLDIEQFIKAGKSFTDYIRWHSKANINSSSGRVKPDRLREYYDFWRLLGGKFTNSEQSNLNSFKNKYTPKVSLLKNNEIKKFHASINTYNTLFKKMFGPSYKKNHLVPNKAINFLKSTTTNAGLESILKSSKNYTLTQNTFNKIKTNKQWLITYFFKFTKPVQEKIYTMLTFDEQRALLIRGIKGGYFKTYNGIRSVATRLSTQTTRTNDNIRNINEPLRDAKITNEQIRIIKNLLGPLKYKVYNNKTPKNIKITTYNELTKAIQNANTKTNTINYILKKIVHLKKITLNPNQRKTVFDLVLNKYKNLPNNQKNILKNSLNFYLSAENTPKNINQKNTTAAATKIQASVRGYMARKQIRNIKKQNQSRLNQLIAQSVAGLPKANSTVPPIPKIPAPVQVNMRLRPIQMYVKQHLKMKPTDTINISFIKNVLLQSKPMTKEIEEELQKIPNNTVKSYLESLQPKTTNDKIQKLLDNSLKAL